MMLDHDQYEEYEEQHVVLEVSPKEILAFNSFLNEYILYVHDDINDSELDKLDKIRASVHHLVQPVQIHDYLQNYVSDIEEQGTHEVQDVAFTFEATLNDQELIGGIIAKYDDDLKLKAWLNVEGISYHYQVAKDLKN